MQQLIAFVFGLIGHAGADTPWHSLGHNGGLIQSMEYTEFGQDYQAAHTRADIGPCGRATARRATLTASC